VARPQRRPAGALLAAVLAGATLAGSACASGSTGAPADVSLIPPASADAPTASVTAAELCADAVPTEVGAAPTGLTEASGLAASRAHAGVLWSHDDSGGAPEVFALGADGSDQGRVSVSGAPAVDWEDIALLAGRDGGADRLVIGDIGDNPGSGERDTVPARLVVVDEPAPPGAGASGASSSATVVAVAYPDGARDAETVLADPRTGDVFVVSKQWDGDPTGVYRVPSLTTSSTPVTMERVASVGGEAVLATGGDVSPDGSIVALRTYPDVRLWDRGPDDTVAQALARPPACTVPVAERQGEAVAFTADGRGFVTISEGAGVPLLVRHLP
jgi:hypothetical protein